MWWFSDHFFCLVCGPLEKKKEKKKKRGKGERERERERKRERCMVWGACILLRRIASDQYSLLLHDSILDKIMQYLSDIRIHNH